MCVVSLLFFGVNEYLQNVNEYLDHATTFLLNALMLVSRWQA
jgi:hypothetical protein